MLVGSPLTNFGQGLAFRSPGLPILSRKGRGRVPRLLPLFGRCPYGGFTSPLAGEDTQAARGEADCLAEVGEGCKVHVRPPHELG
jgi:hypothetical protein